MDREPRPFLDQRMTRDDHNLLSSLIGMTTLPCGISKRQLKSVAQIWEVTEKAFGIVPLPGEPFLVTARRARDAIASIPSSKRTTLRNSAFPECHLLSVARALADPNRAKPNKPIKNNGYSAEARDAFYISWPWRTLRMEVLKERGATCECCGARPGMLTTAGLPVRIVVDHIQPLVHFWKLRLVKSNLQVLCDECNMGKGAWDQTDWRHYSPQAALNSPSAMASPSTEMAISSC